MNDLVGHHSRVSALCCHSAGLSLYSGGQDRFILQWDARPPVSSLKEDEEEGDDDKGKKSGTINPYTVDRWSSSEDEG